METLIKTFLEQNLDTYSPITWKILKIENLTKITNDPEHEMLYIANLIPTKEYATLDEFEINIRGLNNALQMQEFAKFAKSGYACTIEPPILLNSTLLLPITILS